MPELVKGFQTLEGTTQYDFGSLANVPNAIKSEENLDEFISERVAGLGGGGGGTGGPTVSLDTTLTKEGYAAEARAVGQALGYKLNTNQLQPALDAALEQAKASGDFKGEPGDDYILTDTDKNEIAELAATMVKAPEVNLTGYATQTWVSQNYQTKGNYLTSIPAEYAKTEDIPTDAHINSLIDAKFAQFTNVAEVGA